MINDNPKHTDSRLRPLHFAAGLATVLFLAIGCQTQNPAVLGGFESPRPRQAAPPPIIRPPEAPTPTYSFNELPVVQTPATNLTANAQAVVNTNDTTASITGIATGGGTSAETHSIVSDAVAGAVDMTNVTVTTDTLQLLGIDFPNRVVTREMSSTSYTDSRDSYLYPGGGWSNCVSRIGFLTPSFTDSANVRARFYNPQKKHAVKNPIVIESCWLVSTNGGRTNIYPVTFGGRTNVTLAPDAWVDSDVFTCGTLHSNMAYYVYTKIMLPSFMETGLVGGVPLRFGAGSAAGMVPDAWRVNVTTNGLANMFGWLDGATSGGMGGFGPQVIFGRQLDQRGCVALIGSSSLAGAGCEWPTVNQPYGGLSAITAAFSNNWPYVMLAASGTALSSYVSNEKDKEAFALSTCDRALFLLGLNDIRAGATSVDTLKSYMAAAWAPWLAAGKPVFVLTFQPDATSSTNGYTNLTQIPYRAETITNLNNWIRTEPYGIHCLDYASLFETSSNSVMWTWLTNGSTLVPLTGDGLHVNTNANPRIFSFFTNAVRTIFAGTSTQIQVPAAQPTNTPSWKGVTH